MALKQTWERWPVLVSPLFRTLDFYSTRVSLVFNLMDPISMKEISKIFCYLEQIFGLGPLVWVFCQAQFDKITKFFWPFGRSIQEGGIGLLNFQQNLKFGLKIVFFNEIWFGNKKLKKSYPHRWHFVVRWLHLSKLD